MAFPPLRQLQVDLGALPGSADVDRSGWGRRGENGAAGAGSAESLRLRSALPIQHLSQHLLTPGAPIRGAPSATGGFW